MNKILKIVLLFLSVTVYGQGYNNEEVETKVLTRHQASKNLVRWATTTPSSWLKGLKYGYRIERYTFYRDGVRLVNPEKKVLSSTVLPDPLASWEQIVGKNDYAAILAQAIYGESFEVGGNNNEDALLQIINKARESEQRFAFGLFAADMNFEAAVKAGLGYEDTSILANEDYYYKVVPLTPKNILDIKSGGALVKGTEVENLPKPIDLYSVPQDKAITLTWDYQLFKNLYVGYFVERSEDGTTFNRLNKSPLVNMNEKEGVTTKKMVYADSIPLNNKKYHYRVIGITSFGEESPPSEVNVQSGFKTLEEAARISDYKLTLDGGVELIWEFNKNAEKEITSFEVNRADKDRGVYKVLVTDISPSKRNVKLKEIEPSNYYTISAIGSNNQKTTSLIKFVQSIDSIPPLKPQGLLAKIDSTGVVRLKWSPNVEKDLLGYRIYRANIEKEEYVQLTVGPIAQENFDDNVQLKSLNDKVFYKVVAVDKRFNMSEYSEALTVKKPDVVPPAAPVFKSYKVEEGKVNLLWINSNSDDVAFHKLYKKDLEIENSNWDLVFSTKDKTEFIDSNLEGKKRYRYAIFAEDESGLVSEPSTPITLTVKGSSKKQKLIKRANGFADRTNNKIQLSWTLNEQVKELLVYKAKNEEKPVLFKQYTVIIKGIEDSKINPGNIYKYTLKATDSQGGTEFKKITITY